MNPYPDFASSAKHWDTTSACNSTFSHKRKKHPPASTAPSGCSNPVVDTKAVEKQSPREEPHGEPSIDPMAAEAAVAVDKGPGCSVHKQAKLDSHPGSPEVSSGSSQVVHVSEAYYELAATSPPQRQYLTRSKAASAIKCPGVPLGRSGRPSKTSSSVDSCGFRPRNISLCLL
jgi:hypothetical protein